MTRPMTLALSSQELVACRFMLNPNLPTNILARICDDLDFDPMSPNWDNVQRKQEIRSFVKDHNYYLYPQLCIGCMRHRGTLVAETVSLECPRCYSAHPYYKGEGYYRLQNLSLLLGLAPYGREFAYLSQIIYQLLQVTPYVTHHDT